MLDSILYVFTPSNFEAHSTHFVNTPVLMWVLIFANLLIFLAYQLIPAALIYLVWKRKDIMFTGIFWLFAAFIVLCGFHHLIHVITFWYPIYALEAIEDTTTGLVSIGTFFAVLHIIPLALKLKTPKELEEINAKLSTEVENRKKAEEELKQKNLKFGKINQDITKSNEELGKLNKILVDRELKMIELKKENEELKKSR